MYLSNSLSFGVPVSKVAPLLYLAPPVAAIVAVPLFGETLLPVQIGGTLLTVAGALLARSRG